MSGAEKKKKLKSLLLKYGISAAAGGLFVYFYYTSYVGEFTEILEDRSETAVQYLCLCNGFTVPGILFLSIGALVFVSSKGFFDGISYALRGLVRRLVPGGQTSEGSMEKYYDYLQRKKDKRIKGYSFLFVTGMIFLGIGLVFQTLYGSAL